LDKPRKLRVDFYAHLEDYGVDQSVEEECESRNLLDPVDEHRSLVETFMSLGVDQGAATKKVSELYSPPRVTREAQRRPALGISGLRAFDLSTTHPEGGSWNFNLKEHRDLATRICEDDDPDRLIGSPSCTDFSVLGQWNHKRMKIENVRRRLREARRHLQFCVVLYNKQLARGKHFLHEHPQGASSWREGCVERLANEDGVSTTVGHSCQYGMIATDKSGTPRPIMKPTRWLSSSANAQEAQCKMPE
jgi:hypothetical protein